MPKLAVSEQRLLWQIEVRLSTCCCCSLGSGLSVEIQFKVLGVSCDWGLAAMIMSKVGSNISFKLRSSWAHSSRLRLCLGSKVFGFLGCLRNSQYCVYLIIECLKRYYLLCFSLVYVLLVLVTFLWLLDHGLWRVQGGHALYIYARVRCYCYCIYMYIYNAYVAYVRRMYACITFHAGVIHKHWCLVSFHLFSFYFYAMMYVVRFLLFIWLIDVCMVCMLFIRLPIQRFICFLYTFATMANDNATTILVLFRFYQRHI